MDLIITEYSLEPCCRYKENRSGIVGYRRGSHHAAVVKKGMRVEMQ